MAVISTERPWQAQQSWSNTGLHSWPSCMRVGGVRHWTASTLHHAGSRAGRPGYRRRAK